MLVCGEGDNNRNKLMFLIETYFQIIGKDKVTTTEMIWLHLGK